MIPRPFPGLSLSEGRTQNSHLNVLCSLEKATGRQCFLPAARSRASPISPGYLGGLCQHSPTRCTAPALCQTSQGLPQALPGTRGQGALSTSAQPPTGSPAHLLASASVWAWVTKLTYLPSSPTARGLPCHCPGSPILPSGATPGSTKTGCSVAETHLHPTALVPGRLLRGHCSPRCLADTRRRSFRTCPPPLLTAPGPSFIIYQVAWAGRKRKKTSSCHLG